LEKNTQDNTTREIMTKAIYFIFFFSGFAGLIYEGTWSRYLKMFLGHSSYGQILTLVIYMGGLGIGSFIAAKISRRIKNVHRAYALVEIILFFYGLVYHNLFVNLSTWFYDSSFTASMGPSSINALKISLMGLITLPPAILLGMTFPFMANGLIRLHGDSGQRSLSMLYFTNSLGAVMGIVLTGFIFIPQYGTNGTLVVAAVFNLVIGVSVWILAGNPQHTVATAVDDRAQPTSEPTTEPTIEPTQTKIGAESNANSKEHLQNDLNASEPTTPQEIRYRFDIPLWLFIAFGTGLTSFIYEIDWMRMLSLMMGASTHSFDIMLAAFIAGLSIGSLAIKRVLTRNQDVVLLLSLAQLLMGLAALSTVYFYQTFFEWMNNSNLMFARTLWGYELWTGFKLVLAVLWMAPTSFFAGMTLPLITLFLIRRSKSESLTGQVYGWNTLGAITGASVAGLVMLPLLQLKWTLAIAAISDIATGYILLLLYKPALRKNIWLPLGLILLIHPVFLLDYNMGVLTSGVFRSHHAILEDSYKDSTEVRSGRTATISFHKTKLQKYIKTNGKTDASIYRDKSKPLTSDERTQAGTAFIPMAAINKPYDAAVVGFGSGMTIHYILSDPLLQSLDMVEIEKEMIELAKGFRPDNERAFSDPRVQMIVDDARTYFHTAQKSYDVIISVPSNPWVSGVSGLFSVEFYQHIQRFMRPGGMLVQWLQLYEFDTKNFLHILKALDENFKHVCLYQIPEEPDVVMLAGNEPISQQYIKRFLENDTIRTTFAKMQRPYDYFGEGTFLTCSKDLSPLLAKTTPNSDFKPVVDHSAEATRFIGAEVDLMEVLDKRGLPWHHLLAPEDWKLRKQYITEKYTPMDAQLFKEKAFSTLLRQFNAQDSLTVPAGFRDWADFYFEWEDLMLYHPLDESRDTVDMYIEMMNLVWNDELPNSLSILALFWDAVKIQDWSQAIALTKVIMEEFDLATLPTHTLRAMAITLSYSKDWMMRKEFFFNGVLMNEDMAFSEKQLIQHYLKQ
jgi:spermidine synthase